MGPIFWQHQKLVGVQEPESSDHFGPQDFGVGCEAKQVVEEAGSLCHPVAIDRRMPMKIVRPAWWWRDERPQIL